VSSDDEGDDVYMAPEWFTHRMSPTPAVDVYSLAVLVLDTLVLLTSKSQTQRLTMWANLRKAWTNESSPHQFATIVGHFFPTLGHTYVHVLQEMLRSDPKARMTIAGIHKRLALDS
jgi:serine/threonine protein kinase